MDAEYALRLPFDTDDPQFMRGVEIGRLWEILNGDSEAHIETVHASNAEMLLRLAEATGRTVQTEDLDETWVLATFAAPADIGS